MNVKLISVAAFIILVIQQVLHVHLFFKKINIHFFFLNNYAYIIFYLVDPNDSQRVAQVIQDSRIVVIVVLDQALHDILDHKKSRRLLNKIRGTG